MAKIFPFRGYHYDPRKVKLDDVVTQPYDKIDAAMQDEYYRRSPHNATRLLKAKELPGDNELQNKYTRAYHFLHKWIDEGVLVRDELPTIYAYHQEYEVAGDLRVRKGFIALAEVEPFGATVKAHETTLAAPKADRLNLMKATHANFGHIFMLYSDPERAVNRLVDERIAGREPDLRATDDFGNTHKVWKIQDAEAIKGIQRVMADRELFIADGHHRYETGVNYYNAMRELGVEETGDESIHNLMMTLINLDEPGLTVLATHRMVHSLADFSLEKLLARAAEHFEVEEFPYGADEDPARDMLFARMDALADAAHVFGLWAREGSALYLLRLKDEAVMDDMVEGKSDDWKRLDVTILHTILMDAYLGIDARALEAQANVKYGRYRTDTLERAKADEQFQLVFFVNPTKAAQVKAVAEHGEKMPQKSTDFYPKLLSGLTINKINVE